MIDSEKDGTQSLEQSESDRKFAWIRGIAMVAGLFLFMGPIITLSMYLGLHLFSILPPAPNPYEIDLEEDSELEEIWQKDQQQESQDSSQKSVRLIWYLRCKGTPDDDDDCPSKEVIYKAQELTKQIDKLSQQRKALKR